MPSFTNPVFAADAHAAAPATQQDGASLLKPVDPQRRVTVRFTDIDAFVQVLVTPGAGQPAAAAPQQPGKAQQPQDEPPQDHDIEAGPNPGAAPAKNKERQILFKITGTAEPGCMLALMGPSGSGKSSLLTVLGGRNRARITGTLRFNDHPLNKGMKRRMGFVTQDDLLYAELTTFETLFYAALLRLPKTWTRSQKLERVEMVLRGLGLDKARDTIIGNHMMRGVSGGERKRVSIGHELLINPSVILLDEPTSGLDSTTALKLIQTLRALATGGRTIIASIHQPSSRLYQEFDKLMLLSEGYAIYYGDAQASAHWFALQGVPVPFGVSMPDHLLDLACGDLTGSTPREVASTLQQRLVAAFAERTFGRGDDGVQPSDFGTAAPGIAVATEEDEHDGHHPRHREDSDSGASARQKALGLPVDSSTTAVTAHTDGASSSSPTELSGVVAVVKPHQQQQRGSASGSASPTTTAAATATPGDGSKGKGHAIAAAAAAGSEISSDDEEDDEEEDGRRQQQQRAAAAAASAGVRQGKAARAEGHWGASFPQQIMILMSRCLRVRRFQSLTIQRFVEVILVALLAGLFWFQVSGPKGTQLTDQAISDIQGLLFFQLLFTSFSSLFSALFTFPADFAILVKERQSGMYRLSAYYLARTATEIPIDCLVPTIMTIIIYFMGGLRLSAGAFFCNWATMLLTMLVAQSIGLFLSATINDNKTLLSVTTVFMLATMLIAGFYVQNVPVWIAWAKWLSFIRYGYILLQQIEFTGRGMDCGDYYRDNPSAPQGLTWCPITGSPTIPSEVGESVATQVCVLFAFLIAVRIAVYVSLARRTTFKVKAL